MTRRVLMVDDEEALVWSLARQVGRERPDLAFEGLSDPEEALRRITTRPPDLLVTDVRMPKMSGLELLLAARRVAPQLPVIVVTAYGDADVRRSVARTPSVQYLEKPFATATLLEAIDRGLAPAGFSGAVSLQLPDLIQLYALAQMTGALHIARGADEGVVWFERGGITHAECGAQAGADAVYALLRWNAGAFSLEPGAQPARQSITASWQELLIEGFRLMDETGRDAGASDGAEASEDAHAAAWRECVREAWDKLGPLLTNSNPETAVWAVRLGDGVVEPLNGARHDATLGAAVNGLLECLTAVVGEAPRGSGEWVSDQIGMVLAWDRALDLAMVFGESLREGPASRARFRSQVVRWCQACGLADRG